MAFYLELVGHFSGANEGYKAGRFLEVAHLISVIFLFFHIKNEEFSSASLNIVVIQYFQTETKL